ncbi:MAG: hypothetical protein AAGA42_19200 [Actinomycetota bacterium]
MSEWTVSRRVRVATGVVLAGAVALAGLSAWRVDASGGGEDSTYVPVTPCRLFDTRSGSDNVGSRSTPLGAGVGGAHVQQVTGVNGDCEVPVGAVGVSLNVTVTNGTAQSNLRLYPDGVEVPLASNLNWVAGQAPTPNKVDVKLSADGRVVVQNFKGTVDVIADVVGYSTRGTLGDIETRLAALEAGNGGDNSDSGDDGVLAGRVDALELVDQQLAEDQRVVSERVDSLVLPFSVEDRRSSTTALTSTPQTVMGIEVAIPAEGRLTMVYGVNAENTTPGGGVRCHIIGARSSSSTIFSFSPSSSQWFASDDARQGSVAGTSDREVSPGEAVYDVRCIEVGGAGTVRGGSITAVFTPLSSQ